MATDKVYYINGVQVAPRALSNAVLTNGVYRKLHKIDLGKVPRETWEDPRVGVDGMRRRGPGAYGGRDMSWTIMSEVNASAVSASSIERVRDDEWQELLDLLVSDDLLTLKATRMSYPSTAISRVIYADAGEPSGWQWQKTSLDEGFVGRHDGPICVMAIPFHCPFPWWMDETATTTAELTLDGTTRTTVITNLGARPCGIKFNIEGSAAAGLTVVVTNVTSGISAAIGGPGVTLAGITLHATNGWTVDQYVDDPQEFRAYREANGADALPYLAARPRVWLDKGANTIQYRVTAGTPAGGETIQFSHRAWWGAP